MQYFKGDEQEIKIYESAKVAIDQISLQKDLFFEGAYETGPLGDMIYDSSLSPLSNAIPQEIFRDAFKEIFDSFLAAGTFENYLTVFRKIFGETVSVVFNVPDPGKLGIAIEADGVELSKFIARYIEDNEYIFDYIVDDVGDNIVFQTIKGFQTQYELEQMLFEMVPDGIYTTISLDLGA